VPSAAADLLRPSAEEAKPDDRKPLTPTVTRSLPKIELSLARSSCCRVDLTRLESAHRIRLCALSACLRPRQRRNRDAFRWLDSRPYFLEQVDTGSLFACSCSPCTRLPATNRLTVSGTSRRIRLPCRDFAHLAACVTLPGKMLLPNFCNRRNVTSTLWTVRLPNHLHLRLSPWVVASTIAYQAETWHST